jgi:hypothetical protein
MLRALAVENLVDYLRIWGYYGRRPSFQAHLSLFFNIIAIPCFLCLKMLEDAGGKWGNAVAKRETLVVSSALIILLTVCFFFMHLKWNLSQTKLKNICKENSRIVRKISENKKESESE